MIVIEEMIVIFFYYQELSGYNQGESDLVFGEEN